MIKHSEFDSKFHLMIYGVGNTLCGVFARLLEEYDAQVDICPECLKIYRALNPKDCYVACDPFQKNIP
jgi:hypothetical protein